MCDTALIASHTPGPHRTLAQFAEGRGRVLNSTTEYATSGVLRLVWALDRGLAETYHAGALDEMLAEGGDDMSVARLPLPAFKAEWDSSKQTGRFLVVLYTLIGLSSLTGALTSMSA